MADLFVEMIKLFSHDARKPSPPTPLSLLKLWPTGR